MDPVPGLPYRGQTNLATWINCESKVSTGAMETFALKMGVLVCWSGSVSSLSSSLGQPARSISVSGDWQGVVLCRPGAD